jgi:hypothetical protein
VSALDLFGRELLAVDCTRIKAVNNKDRNFTMGSLQKFIEAADKKLEDYLKRLDAGDAKGLCQHGGLCISSDAVKFDEHALTCSMNHALTCRDKDEKK